MFEISRRDLVLSAACAYAAFGLTKPIAFIGAAEAQQTPNFRKYKVGDIEVISLYDGVWEKPHDENFIKGADVEQTKAALRAAGLADAHVPIPFTMIAINTSGRLVLIDLGTGGGQVGGPKAGVLTQSMTAAGLDPKNVKTVIVSHFHPDHIFGLMAKDTNAQMFPEAEIIVPAAELKWWTQPVEFVPGASSGTRSARAGDVAELEERQAGRWRGRAGAGRARHSRVRPYPGPHRPSHQLRRQAAARHGRRHQHSCTFRQESGVAGGVRSRARPGGGDAEETF